jgi:hypothetical protein
MSGANTLDELEATRSSFSRIDPTRAVRRRSGASDGGEEKPTVGDDGWYTSTSRSGRDADCCLSFWCGCQRYAKTQYRVALLERHEDDKMLFNYKACNPTC